MPADAKVRVTRKYHALVQGRAGKFVLAVTAAESLQGLTICLREGTVSLWIPIALAVTGLAAGGYLYHVQRVERTTQRAQKELRRIWFVAVVVIAAEHLTLIEFAALTSSHAGRHASVPLLTFSSAVFVLALAYAFRNRERFGIRLRSAVPEGSTASRARYLSVFLSKLPLGDPPNLLAAPTGVADRAAGLAELDATHARSWSQPIRAIGHQVDLNEGGTVDVVVVPSEQSAPQTRMFATLLRRFFTPSQVRLRACAVARTAPGSHTIEAVLLDEDRFDELESSGIATELDFDDIDMLWDTMDWLLPPGAAWPNAPDQEIIVDLTGGTKVTSVVGALITVDRDVRAQYVETGAPGSSIDRPLRVKSYDLGTRERAGLEK